jgi:hypothetical protein
MRLCALLLRVKWRVVFSLLAWPEKLAKQTLMDRCFEAFFREYHRVVEVKFHASDLPEIR